MNISLSAFAPENLVSRDGFGSPVPRQPAHLYTQAESGAYLRGVIGRSPIRRPDSGLNRMMPTPVSGSCRKRPGYTRFCGPPPPPPPPKKIMGFLPSSAAASNYLFKTAIRHWVSPVPSLSGHAFAYRWRSLPRVRRHRASQPQGSSERVLPWQVTMDQLICASLSHTHYWYKWA